LVAAFGEGPEVTVIRINDKPTPEGIVVMLGRFAAEFSIRGFTWIARRNL
jgi:hypothetical protein